MCGWVWSCMWKGVYKRDVRGKDRHATVCIRTHRCTGGSSCLVAPGSHLVLAWWHRCCERKILFLFFCPVARRYARLLLSYSYTSSECLGILGVGCTRERDTQRLFLRQLCVGVQESQDAERCFGSFPGMRMLGDTGRRCFYIDKVRLSLIFPCTFI